MTLGLPTALLYNFKLRPQDKAKFFTAALLMGTGLGFLASLLGIFFLPRWLSQYSPEVIHTAQWFMVIAPVLLLGTILGAALEAEGEFTFANQLRYLQPLMTLIVLSGLVWAEVLTPLTAGLAYLLPTLPLLIWILAYLRRRFSLSWLELGSSCKRLISYGLRSYGVDLLGTLSAQIGQAMVVSLLTPADMGIYVIALSLSRMLDVLQSSIITVLLPKTAARPVKEIVKLTGRLARISLLLTLLATILIIILAPILLPLLYGQEFLKALLVLRILLIEVTIGGTLWVLAQAFMAAGRPGIVTILQSLGLGLSIPLLLFFIPMYGFVGAGLALLCSTIVRFICVLICYPLILKVPPPNLLVTVEDWRFLKQKWQT
jgi:O-antigen/teichoic acid export membrane protein